MGTGRSLIALGRTDEAVGPLRNGRDEVARLGALGLIEEADRLLGEATALSS
jgi:hypothetical protein